MQSAPPRDDEAASLAALHALDVLDSGPEAEFDALVRAASIVCGVPISLLSLIDAERQWFKANIGLPGVSETPRDLAFCAHAVLDDELFEVTDAALDARFADNPLVADQPGIRFYAGAPLRLSDGSRIGTLCVIDRRPQRLSDSQRQVLMELATAAAQALEGRRAMRAVKQISRAMADSEARFRALSESAPIGVFELDALGNFSYGNQRLLDIVGLRRGQVLSWMRIVHADDRKELSLRWSNALARQQDLDAQFRVLRPDGGTRHLHANARLRLSEDGLPSGYVGTVEDVTEVRHQQDELRTSRAFLDRTGRLGGVGGWELNLADNSMYWSDETCRIHGLPAGHSPSLEEAVAFYAPEARPLIQQAVEHAVATGAGFDLELPQQLRDGRSIWVRAVGSIEFEDGRAARLVGAFQDVSERVNERLALEEAHSLVQLAADSGGIGIWDYDLVQDSLKWDAWMYRLYGHQPSEELGKHDLWARHLHPDDRLVTEQAMQDAIAGKREFAAEFRIVWADGSVHSIRSSAMIKRDPTGRALRMVGVNWDTTEQHRIEAELREAKRVAEAANKAKSEFLANMSHEIRTPMNAILGMLTLLRRTSLSERQADYAGKTEGAARALLGLLNEILDFSKVEAGKMTLDPQPMRLDHLLRDLSVILAANVGAKKLQLLFDIDPALPNEWVVDAMRLQQVLLNLAGNAIKFTEQGEVMLSIALLQQDGDALRARFAVRDTGIGIAPENQARIFDGFTQAEASTTRRFGGTGLGLAISQRLVALMGGELSLHSELGLGSVFEFSLTLKRSGVGPGPALPAFGVGGPAGRRRLAGLRLLLVEDNLNNQQVACELLSEEGALVQIAADGQQAINALAGSGGASAFDIVLMDLQMPVMDGYAATRHLREVLGLRDLPVIAMTANAMSSDRAACLAAGMNDHVGKPFDLDDLVRVLRQHAGLAVAAAVGYKPAELAPALRQAAIAAAAGGVDLGAALQRMGGKPAVYRRMLGGFLQELPALQQQMSERLALADGAACLRLLHTVKGVAATLGADQLADQVGRQERALAAADAAAQASMLSACVAAACAAMAAALPGLTELARQLQASAAELPDEGLAIAQLPSGERPTPGAAVAELLRLLQDSDMAALAQMSVLQTRYGATLGAALEPLEEALSRLDFVVAMTQCKALLAQLAAESA